MKDTIGSTDEPTKSASTPSTKSKPVSRQGKFMMIGLVMVIVCCVCAVIAVAAGVYVVSDADSDTDNEAQTEGEAEEAKDTTPPDLSITEKDEEFILLEDYEFKVKSEEGAKIFVNDKEVGVYADENDMFKFTPENGENEAEVYAVDAAGNKSEPIILSFTAFMKSGYKLISCGGVSLPLNTALLKVGYSGFKGGVSGGYTLEQVNGVQCEKTGDHIYLPIKEIGTLVPCVNCDGSVTYIDLKSSKKPFSATGAYEDDSTVISENAYTTVSGVKGRLVEVKYETIISSYYSYEFIFEVDGFQYAVTLDTTGSGNVLQYDPTQKAAFMEIVDALVIE